MNQIYSWRLLYSRGKKSGFRGRIWQHFRGLCWTPSGPLVENPGFCTRNFSAISGFCGLQSFRILGIMPRIGRVFGVSSCPESFVQHPRWSKSRDHDRETGAFPGSVSWPVLGFMLDNKVVFRGVEVHCQSLGFIRSSLKSPGKNPGFMCDYTLGFWGSWFSDF